MDNHAEIRQKAREAECVAVIPVYNNAGTVGGVIERVKLYVDDVIVVNDGSTDGTGDILAGMHGIDVISYPDNRGKGHALRRGLAAADGRGFRHAMCR